MRMRSSSNRSTGRLPGSTHWRVTLRCPNCEWTGTGVFGQEDRRPFRSRAGPRNEGSCRRCSRASARACMEADVEAVHARARERPHSPERLLESSLPLRSSRSTKPPSASSSSRLALSDRRQLGRKVALRSSDELQCVATEPARLAPVASIRLADLLGRERSVDRAQVKLSPAPPSCRARRSAAA